MIQFITRDKGEDLGVSEYVAQLLVFDFGQGRIHHQDQADGDGYVSGAGLEAVDETCGAGYEITKRDSQGHRPEDPKREITVEEAEFLAFGGMAVVCAHGKLIFL
jgi:hypothetical protein